MSKKVSIAKGQVSRANNLDKVLVIMSQFDNSARVVPLSWMWAMLVLQEHSHQWIAAPEAEHASRDCQMNVPNVCTWQSSTRTKPHATLNDDHCKLLVLLCHKEILVLCKNVIFIKDGTTAMFNRRQQTIHLHIVMTIILQ